MVVMSSQRVGVEASSMPHVIKAQGRRAARHHAAVNGVRFNVVFRR